MGAKLMARLNLEWQIFLDSFAGLPDSALSESGVVGNWSIRDILGHITTWENEALDRIAIVLAHEKGPGYSSYGGVDGFNAIKVNEKRAKPLNQIRRELVATHKSLLDRIADIPDSAVDAEFRRRFSNDTWAHYRQHAKQIRAWRSKR